MLNSRKNCLRIKKENERTKANTEANIKFEYPKPLNVNHFKESMKNLLAILVGILGAVCISDFYISLVYLTNECDRSTTKDKPVMQLNNVIRKVQQQN